MFEDLCLTTCKAVLSVLEDQTQHAGFVLLCHVQIEDGSVQFVFLGLVYLPLESGFFFKRTFVFVIDMEE